MSDIRKADANPLFDRNLLVIGAGHKTLHGIVRVFHRIKGRDLRNALVPCPLAASPLRFLHLNVGGIPQHDPAKIRRRLGGIDLAAKPVRIQKRQEPGMVNMCMG